MTVEIFVARHGQNEDNFARILGGHRDKPLTALGRQQAYDLGKGIIDLGLTFEAVYCSPLSRAHQTAQIVTKVIGLREPEVLPGLIERDFGSMTGEKIDDIEKLSDDTMKIGDIVYFFGAEGAETFPNVLVRANKILAEVRARHESGKVLLVCHGDIGSMLYAAATGKPWREVLEILHFSNADLIDIGKHHEAHVIKLEQTHH
jgi:probable phosphoglycerate mutase